METKSGLVCTFYSYKGGVGRSMALANVAAMLARLGQKVLVVDWDLEAPGLERFFGGRVRGSRRDTPGLVDLVSAYRSEESLNWRTCLLKAAIPEGETVDILHAGRDDAAYLDKLNSIHWDALFDQGFGRRLEELRTEWIKVYDYVLIDSRTGITDVGGICSILLPDYLVSMFTATESSLLGVKNTMLKARAVHADLPLNRRRLVIIPIAARDESNREYERAAQWRKRFAQELAEFYNSWIDKGESAESVLDYLKIPYVAFWSFGESLPVLEEDPKNPKNLAYSYALIARLLHGRLDWSEVREGRKAAEAASAQAAESQVRRAEAEKLRADAQAQQNAEAARVFEKRQERVFQRFAELSKTLAASSRQILFLLIALVGCGVLVLYLVLPFVVYPISLHKLSLLTLEEKMLLGLAGGAVVLFFYLTLIFCMMARRSRRKLAMLDRERVAYEIRSGDYTTFDPEAALIHFAERMEFIAAPNEVPDRTPTSSSVAQPGVSGAMVSPVRPSDSATQSSPPVVLSPPAEQGSIEGDKTDVYLTYQPIGIVPAWVAEFKPLFESWLGEAIYRYPVVFDAASPVANTESTGNAVARIRETARTAVFIFTRRTLESSRAQEEFSLLFDRYSIGRLFPLALDRMPTSVAPRPLAELQWADFSDLAYVGEGFSRSERYVEFQDRVRSFAERVGKSIIDDSALDPAEQPTA